MTRLEPLMTLRSFVALALVSCSWGCGSDSSDEETRDGNGTPQGGGSANGGSANAGSANGGSANAGSANGGSANGGSANGIPRPKPSAWQGAMGERGQCGLAGGSLDASIPAVECENRTLPGSGKGYCVAASPECSDASASCPLFMTFYTSYGNRLQHPDRYGPFISVTAEPRSVEGVDFFAELPRQIAEDYPGLDANRIYAVGHSYGGHIIKSALLGSKRDSSAYGTTSDLYAGIASLGMWIESDENWTPNGYFAAIQIGGSNDPFDMNGSNLGTTAGRAGCAKSTSEWDHVQADDPLVPGADGTDIADRAGFGSCPNGDYVAYRFKDEGHTMKFKVHFDPAVSASAMAWDFLQGRTKDDTGFKGLGSACRPE
jgi:poly(3-hydroxybutyrate) depolymerase